VPLTIAHPSVVVPLQKAGLPLSALIIGSVVPDFEFFLRISSARVIAHTVPGIFLFCLPLGLLMYFFFHSTIKKPLLSLLPPAHQSRILHKFEPFRGSSLWQFLKISLALLIGIFSHHLLDSITHENSFFTNNLPFLSYSVLIAPFGEVRMYFLLQQFFSFTGISMMVLWYLNWYKSFPAIKNNFYVIDKKSKTIIVVLIIFFTIATAMTVGPMVTFFKCDPSQVDFYQQLISHSAIATVTGFLSALVVYSLSWHIFLSAKQKQPTVTPCESLATD
jgi:hypothetical protein